MENSFIRTESGIKNEHLFHNTDYVVYLEGGQTSFSLSQVIDENLSSDNTLDIVFWSRLFSRFMPDKTVKYKSIGSKVVLKEIADIIITKDIKTVLICMDNEFDEMLNQRIQDKRVLYTYGYSWENEVWTLRTLLNTITEISAINPSTERLTGIYDSFICDNEAGVKADFLLFRDNMSFWNKKARLKYIDQRKNEHFIKIDEMLADIHSKGISDEMLAQVEIDVKKYCFGHLIADGLCWVIRSFLKGNHLSLSVDNECINRIAINEHYRNFDDELILIEYYGRQFDGLFS